MDYRITDLGNRTWHINELVVGMFLLEGEEKAMLLDTGAGMGDLLGTVKKLTDKPLLVVNTHGHMDHAGGNHQFAQVYLHKEDFPLSYEMCTYDVRVYYVKSRVGMHMPEHLEEALASLVPDTDYTRLPLNDGDVIDLGDRPLRVIHTPGHTPGSICLLDEKNRWLFSGDTVNPGGMLLQKEYRCTAYATFVQSLDKLWALRGEYDQLLRCHGAPFGSPDDIPALREVVDGIDKGLYHGVRIKNPMRDGWVFQKGNISVNYDEK